MGCPRCPAASRWQGGLGGSEAWERRAEGKPGPGQGPLPAGEEGAVSARSPPADPSPQPGCREGCGQWGGVGGGGPRRLHPPGSSSLRAQAAPRSEDTEPGEQVAGLLRSPLQRRGTGSGRAGMASSACGPSAGGPAGRQTRSLPSLQPPRLDLNPEDTPLPAHRPGPPPRPANRPTASHRPQRLGPHGRGSPPIGPIR